MNRVEWPIDALAKYLAQYVHIGSATSWCGYMRGISSPKICLLGPSLHAVSGVSTHLNQLFGSELAKKFALLHFQVGSEGRCENLVQRLFRIVLSIFQFLLLLLRYRPDIVHLNTSLEPRSYWRDLVYLLVAILARRAVVFQVHGGALPEEFFVRSQLLTGLLRLVLRQPDVVVLLAQVELCAYRRFAPTQRLEVVPNAIDASVVMDIPLEGKTQGPLHLVYLGRLAENKGIFEIVVAMTLLASEGRQWRMTIGGSGPDEARLRAKVTALSLDNRVDFVGPVFGEVRDCLWRAGHVFTFPTYHREGLPYSLLEAMAAGAVPVTTRVGAIPDVMHHEVHGLFVEPRDAAGLARAIARLDDDRLLLARMAQAGRARVLEQYAMSRLVADFARIYDSLLREVT